MELWFTEQLELSNGSGLTVKIREHLYSGQSEFQKIDVFETEMFGRMLVLDGIIMCTERDESAYHEMIVHVPMQSHPSPKKVLVIGGGDGGTVRELIKYQCEEIHLCEIDKEVVDVSRKYLPTMSSGYSDSRVSLFYENGLEFISSRKEYYDIVIIDSTDPIGPGESLFTEEFYRYTSDALRPRGIVVSQAESLFFHSDFIAKIVAQRKEIFDIVDYYYTMVPTYPSGMIGFTYCSNETKPSRKKVLPVPQHLSYYTGEIHEASFIVPAFMRNLLDSQKV